MMKLYVIKIWIILEYRMFIDERLAIINRIRGVDEVT